MSRRSAAARIPQLAALALVLVSGLLASARPAAAQGGTFWAWSDCGVPQTFSTVDPRGVYLANGSGTFGWDGTSLTIASSQPITAVSRWLTGTTQVGNPNCRPGLPADLGGLDADLVATMRTENVFGGYAHVVLTYWDANQQFLGAQSSTTSTQSGWVGLPGAQSLSGTTDWHFVEAHGTVPPGTRYVRLELRLSGPGRVFVRGVSGGLTSFGHIANLAPPAISGTPRVGELLTASRGTWDPATDLVLLGHSSTFYEWLRCDLAGASCVSIPDAGGQVGNVPVQLGPDPPDRYTVRPADVGSTLRVRVQVGNEDAASDPVSSAAVGPVVAASGNLVPDADLESDPGPFFATNGPGTFVWATDESRSATHALRVESSTALLARWLTLLPAIRAVPGTAYDVSAWLKTLGANANGFLSVNFWTAAGTYIPATVDSPRLVGSHDWTQVALHAVAPPGAAFLRVELRLNGPGTLWADDLAAFPR
jgi:hypothetical protein